MFEFENPKGERFLGRSRHRREGTTEVYHNIKL